MGRRLRKGPRTAAILLVSSLALTIAGCLTEGIGGEGGTEVVADPDDVPAPPLTPPERTVCDPFNAGVSARDRGLLANLTYLTDSQPRYPNARDYILNGTPVQSTLYFDKLFIPTRRFDLGFYTQDGQLVLNHNNQPLYEYFGLRVESQLQLAPNEAPGWYQMAILSDDGSVLSLKDTEGVLTPLVNNDGVHPTRMGCASRSIYMNAGERKPFVVEYYQGPRYHISLAVLWRPLPQGADPNAAVSDAECGRQGNSRYFDYNQVPSVPTSTYYDLLTRGWKPLENSNYNFPEQASNPCAAEEPLIISGFSIDSSTRESVTLSWFTNVPATSRAEAMHVVNRTVISSPEDSTLKTQHIVTITGLSPNTFYAVKGISSRPGGLPVVSDERAFRTPR